MTPTSATPTTPIPTNKVTVIASTPPRLASCVIRPLTVDEFESSGRMEDLIAEYSAISALEDLPPINPSMQMYRELEAIGMYRMFGAYQDETLVGFIGFLVSVLPHYSVKVATCESCFVAKEYRSTGAGLKLLRHAKREAKKIGVTGMFASAIHGSLYERVLPSLGFRSVTNLFFQRF